MGESAGEPRHVASPDLYAESFSAAVDYLGTKAKHVNREQISVIGISGGELGLLLVLRLLIRELNLL